MNREISADEPPDTKRCGRQSGRSIGPVRNLEMHVKPDWWREIFNHLYLKTDGDVVGDQQITEREIDRITAILALSPETEFLDLCCGQGRHTLELVRRGYAAEGLDRSHHLIQKARTAAEHGAGAVLPTETD